MLGSQSVGVNMKNVKYFFCVSLLLMLGIFTWKCSAEQSTPNKHTSKHEENKKSGHQHNHVHMKHMNDVREWLKKELGKDYNKAIPQASKKQLLNGKKIYKNYCVTCHGESGKGDGLAAIALPTKPADFTNPEHATYYSDRGRMYIIKKGVNDSSMIGWGATLSEKEIFNVYSYIKSLKEGEKSDPKHSNHKHKD